MVRNKIIFQCPKCNYTELKKIKLRNRLLKIPKVLFLIALYFSAIMGLLASYNYYQALNIGNEDKIFSLGNSIIAIGNILINFQSGEDKQELKEIALNITKDCNDDYCRAETIYNRLNEFPYNNEEDGTPSEPLKTWKSGIGDCDEMAYLLNILLKQVNIKSTVQASPTHAWTIIKLEDKVILADLTKNKWEVQEI